MVKPYVGSFFLLFFFFGGGGGMLVWITCSCPKISVPIMIVLFYGLFMFCTLCHKILGYRQDLFVLLSGAG